MAGYLLPSMAAASRAALMAPGLPMASVPTGTPAGICTMDSSESMPCKDFDSIGTPRTGKQVLAAVTPARWAAPPAAAIITSNPRPAAPEAHSKSRSGVRWAEMTRTSQGISNSANCVAACCIVSQSDWLPMMTPTKGLFWSCCMV